MQSKKINFSDGKEIVLKPNEKFEFGNLIITHKGGGHKILMDGSDLSFAAIELKIMGTDRTEDFQTNSLDETMQKIWEGYLIKVNKVERDGESVALSITKL